MLPILLFDGATENQFAAIIGINSYLKIQQSRNQSADLLPLIQGLLDQACLTTQDIQGIAVGVGPGSFTGVRVVITTARTMAQVLNVKILPLSSLELAFWAHLPPKPTAELWVPFWDGRKGKVYAAGYNINGHCIFGPGDYFPDELNGLIAKHGRKEKVCLFNPDADWHNADPENRLRRPDLSTLHSSIIALPCQEELFLARIAKKIQMSSGEWTHYESVEPDYLRDPDAVVSIAAN